MEVLAPLLPGEALQKVCLLAILLMVGLSTFSIVALVLLTLPPTRPLCGRVGGLGRSVRVELESLALAGHCGIVDHCHGDAVLFWP
jgi:hypothetical protein